MFIRWKQRKDKLYCYLCKTERVGGRPVSTTLGYLGSCSAETSYEDGISFLSEIEDRLRKYNLPESKIEVLKTKASKRIFESKVLEDQDVSKLESLATFLFDNNASLVCDQEGDSLSPQSQSEKLDRIFMIQAELECISYNLTARQAQVRSLRIRGFSYKAIAKELYISLDTVKQHIKDINQKKQLFLLSESSTPKPGNKNLNPSITNSYS